MALGLPEQVIRERIRIEPSRNNIIQELIKITKSNEILKILRKKLDKDIIDLNKKLRKFMKNNHDFNHLDLVLKLYRLLNKEIIELYENFRLDEPFN